ncbi:MAG: patatin-like phospholipase family protein [Mariprofundaceae bacterium]
MVLALGGGGARALAHIGVIEALKEADIPVRAVAGTSVGAEVGAFLAAGVGVEEMKRLAFGMDWISTLRLFTPDFSEGALSSGKTIYKFLKPYLNDCIIEEQAMGYAAVAADLGSGEEVVIDSGSLMDAVRASMSFPGLISPARMDGRMLVDGGLVNPVPFDVARNHFGGPVLAVQAHAVPGSEPLEETSSPEWQAHVQELLESSWLQKWPQVGEWLQGFRDTRNKAEVLKNMGLSSVLNRSQMISEDMLMQLRQRLMPPDIMLRPAVDDIGLLEFYRGKAAVQAGYQATMESMDRIRALVN